MTAADPNSAASQAACPTSSDPLAPLASALDKLGSVLGPEGEGFMVERFIDNLRVKVHPTRLLDALTTLKTQDGFAMPAELGATDYLEYPGRPAGASRFEVHYVLRDLDENRMIVVKTGVDEPDPALPSVTHLWRGADWMEREVFDMFGITFLNHPDPRRILLPDEFESHPLRKDYPLRGRGERHNLPRIVRAES